MKRGLKEAIANLCSDVDEQIREDFLSRMDRDYFSRYTPQEIANHLRMSFRLGPGLPVQCNVVSQRDRIFDIVVVAFDYFSEFSILCGLLAAFGLDIQAGHIYTFSEEEPKLQRHQKKGRGRGNSSRKKIVDLFRVRLPEGEEFTESRQKEFERELQDLILLLDRNRIQEARTRVNRQVVEYLSRTKGDFMGRLYPVHIKFDNRLSKKWTVMEIHSKDTPAFLYAFSNALSLRGIYIHKVMIENMGSEIRDRVYLCDTQGRRIEGKREQELLRVTTVMIKQFTHFLAWAPDPARAIRYFDQFLDKLMERGSPGSVLSFLRERETLALLARLLGTGEFLWEDFFRMQFENLLPVLQGFKKGGLLPKKEEMGRQLMESLARGRTVNDQKGILNRYKDREMFRIDMKHLLEPSEDLMVFSRALTDLAEVVLDQAYRVCYRHLTKQFGLPLLEDQTVCPFGICGLGKFGGREMGYASDIEALFVYGGPGQTKGMYPIDNRVYFERLAQEIFSMIEAKREGIFRIDLRLRPYGSAGALANPIDQVRRYYSPQGQAAPFERQALTKLRWVAGDESLRREMETHRDLFVYSGEPWDLKTALHLRRRQINELVKPGKVNVKFSPGGVIDIEYAVQYLQVMYGGRHRELRTTSTLEALEGLCRVRIISQKEQKQLREAYLFLRALIDGLRIVRGNASDLVLPDQCSDEMRFLARRLGYSGSDWERGARKLVDAIHRQMANAHHFFASRFERV